MITYPSGADGIGQIFSSSKDYWSRVSTAVGGIGKTFCRCVKLVKFFHKRRLDWSWVSVGMGRIEQMGRKHQTFLLEQVGLIKSVCRRIWDWSDFL